MRTNLRQGLTMLAFLLATGMGSAMAQQQGTPPPPSKFKLMTSAYAEGTQIPAQYTCAVPTGSSPALQWSNPPQATASFALIFHDMEGAPNKGSSDVTHWILWNVPATSTSIAAGIQTDASPDGIQQGKNVRNVNGYQPPCPPPGAVPHHYTFELYALDAKLDLPAGSSRADLLKAMDGHVIGKAAYVGMFGR
jgi:Raf kinase inhibitor-like YbhB/YbcL family protein